MSNYYSANLSFGILLSEEVEEILLTAPKGKFLKLISVGSEYGKGGITNILGVNLIEVSIPGTELRSVSLSDIVKENSKERESIYFEIETMFDKYGIKDEIDLDFYISIYQY